MKHRLLTICLTTLLLTSCSLTSNRISSSSNEEESTILSIINGTRFVRNDVIDNDEDDEEWDGEDLNQDVLDELEQERKEME